MIENMRKYTGLMIVVLVLLAAGLILTMGNFNATAASGGKVTSAYGEDIDGNTFKKMGYSTLRVITTSRDNNLMRYALQNGAYSVVYGTGASYQEALNFVTNRIIIQKEAAKLGIYASEDRAVDYIQNTMFSDKGKFDVEGYNSFIKEIGSSGYTEDDFVKLIGEFQVYSKLTSTLSNGVTASNAESEKFALFEMQSINATTISLSIEDYKKNIKPTEEQVKEYWTLNEGAYQTKRQLKLNYILVNPKFDKPEPKAPKRAEGISDEDYAKLDVAFKKELATWEAEQKKASNLVAGMVDDFSLEIEQDGGDNFVKLSKENGFKPVTTELFDVETAPADLKDLKNISGESIVTILFAQDFGTSEKHQVKAPIKTANSGWFYCRFAEEKASTPKAFEAAKAQATKDYIHQEAKLAMAKAAKDIKAKIALAIKDGKNLEDAAKTLKLSTEKVTALTAPMRDSEQKDIQIFQKASIADPKTFTKEEVDLGDTLILVYLDKRVVYSDPSAQMRLSQAGSRDSSRLSQSIFQSYMSEATKKAEIEMPKNIQQ